MSSIRGSLRSVSCLWRMRRISPFSTSIPLLLYSMQTFFFLLRHFLLSESAANALRHVPCLPLHLRERLTPVFFYLFNQQLYRGSQIPNAAHAQCATLQGLQPADGGDEWTRWRKSCECKVSMWRTERGERGRGRQGGVEREKEG